MLITAMNKGFSLLPSMGQGLRWLRSARELRGKELG